jgi:DNA polymerase III alpha subunit
MLGMTQIDRLRSDLPLYSERFISTARLLENHSLPDYDFNCATQEPFIKATRELLGEHQCYPMLAYGTMQESESFRNACRSCGLGFDEFNEVGKNLDNYRNDPYWQKYIDMAQAYIGTIISCSVHPCSFLLMNEDIREELGILKIGDAYCAPITSGEADAWKYLKNDYLIVTVWDIIKQTFDMIGQPIMSIKELEANLDDKVWELFDKGYTATINQIDGDWATSLIKKYKPRSVSEMAKFVACIRPSFETMRDDFIARKPYTTGFENIDNLFKSTDNRVLFQENIMQYFEWLGVTPSESIGLIKKISKKKIKPKDFAVLEDRLKENWEKNNGTEEGFDKSWADMQSQMAYSFNSPHGLAYAYDGLYCAYLKSHYPLEYYTVTLNIYKDDVEKSNRLCNEMANFGIKLSNVKFRYSNDTYTMDKEHNTIYKSVSSIKNIGKETGDKLYTFKDTYFGDFLSVLSTIDINKCCNSRELNILISIGFFEEFGNPNQLLKIVDIYNKYSSAKVIKKDKLTQREMQIIHKFAQKETEKQFRDIDNVGLINALVDEVTDTTSTLDQIGYDLKYLGYTSLTYNCQYFGVEDFALNDYGTPYIKLYRIATGESDVYKIDKKWYNQFTTEYNGKLEQGDILDITLQEKPKRRKVDDEWVEVGSELVITAFCRK